MSWDLKILPTLPNSTIAAEQRTRMRLAAVPVSMFLTTMSSEISALCHRSALPVNEVFWKTTIFSVQYKSVCVVGVIPILLFWDPTWVWVYLLPVILCQSDLISMCIGMSFFILLLPTVFLNCWCIACCFLHLKWKFCISLILIHYHIIVLVLVIFQSSEVPYSYNPSKWHVALTLNSRSCKFK